MLTVEQLKTMEPGEVIASGMISDERIWKRKVKWAAFRGMGHHDWAIYYANPEDEIDFIRKYGAKVYDKEVVKDLVRCDAEALRLYRK